MRTTTWIKLAATGCMITATAWTPVAHAQGNNKVAAEALFEEGRKLIAQKNPAKACPKFAESQRLDPSPSTLLNLGSCYERIGKTASAWATYREAASAANALGRTGLVTVAQRHAATIEPDLARLIITPVAPPEGLEIKRDGQRVGRGEWEVAVPVDPGTVTVEAVAPKKKRWSSTVEVRQAGKTVQLTVPRLEDLPAEPPPTPPPPPPPTITSGEMTAPAPAPPSVVRDTTTPEPRHVEWQKPAAIVAGGVGVVGLVLGTVFVFNAKSKYDDSLPLCPTSSDRCTPEGVSLRDDARSAGNLATAFYVVGIVSLAAGAVMWFTAPKHDQPRKTAAELHLSPSLGGLTMYGRW